LEAKKQLGDFYGMWIYQQELSAGHIKINKKPYIEPELKNYEFHNEDYLKIMEDHRKDKNAFIFLDPPYLFSDNRSYRPNKEGEDMTSIIIHLSKLMKDKKTKAKIMLVINKLDIVKYFFKDFNIFEYEKIYQVGKKKSIHLVITNYGV
jgi:site-specific DNA-adenine methylase